MKFAIISDIHSNLESLEKAIEIIESFSIEKIICLGDIIGYGANPNECLEIVKKYCDQIILGNHDEASLSSEHEENHFNSIALTSLNWTIDNLNKQSKNFLKKLPYKVEYNDFLFVHSSPKEFKKWHYILTHHEATVNFKFFHHKICFFGHTHIPYVFIQNPTQGFFSVEENSKQYDIKKIFLNKKNKYLINPGSIGQPRDFNPFLSFGIFDSSEYSFQIVRAKYNVRKSAHKILDKNLPEKNAQRLFIGA